MKQGTREKTELEERQREEEKVFKDFLYIFLAGYSVLATPLLMSPILKGISERCLSRKLKS
jgi:hypothetical protein